MRPLLLWVFILTVLAGLAKAVSSPRTSRPPSPATHPTASPSTTSRAAGWESTRATGSERGCERGCTSSGPRASSPSH